MYVWSFVLYVIQLTMVIRRLPRAPAGQMTGGDRALGGYDPVAGLDTDRVKAVQKLPVPSLLRQLLSEHLDPGYAAAAQARASASAPPSRAARRLWQALAALLIAAVFAVAVAQARSTAPG